MMQKTTTRLFLAFGLFVLVSCGGKSPRSVATHYLDAFNNRDFEKAQEYSTEKNKKIIKMFVGLDARMSDSLKRKYDFSVISERVAGDTAYVDYKSAKSNRVETLTLIKIDGEWKVASTKDSINSQQGGVGMESGATNTDTTDNALQPPGDTIKN
jgi:hypothetical protein